MANNVDPGQILHSVASDLCVHGLLMPVHPSTLEKYGASLNCLDDKNVHEIKLC